MNVENILKVADAIEADALPGIGFNMAALISSGDLYTDQRGHNCGTVACIAGYCVLVADLPRGMGVMAPAADWLGIDAIRGEQLFTAFGAESITDLETITPQHAVRALRILAITGRVDWAGAMDPREPELPALPSPAKASTTA